MRKYLSIVVLIIAFSLIATSCDQKADYVDDGIGNIDFSNKNSSDKSQVKPNISYTYPDNPAEALKDYMVNDAKKRELPINIGELSKVDGDWYKRIEFIVHFTNNRDNACVISFIAKNDAVTDNSYALNGKDNPSFTIAFKDPDNSEDMITILTSVIKYLSPDLSLEEARRLAINQDETISIDGYSMPQDIGGYQVQARYTNPHVFIHTQEFDSKFGITVSALKQIWGGIESPEGQELINHQDYHVITPEYMPWEDGYELKTVYADFIVKNVWHYEEWIHGDYWTEVDVESMDGNQYTLRLETMRMAAEYNFGVGQQYTLYITTGMAYGATITYAIQRTALAEQNSCGSSLPLDYPTNDDWINPLERIIPEGKGIIYDVCFNLITRGEFSEPAAALEGYGVGKKQWPSNPVRDEYEFVGWYDNYEGTGKPYNANTPIYQNTNLYVKWKYIGSGGCWPRAHHGIIQGLEEKGDLSVDQKPTITVYGYNMNLVAPNDQRFRWYPVSWRLSNGTSGSFSGKAPFQTTFTFTNKSEMRLYVTYQEEIFDGASWQKTEQVHEVEEKQFKVK